MKTAVLISSYKRLNDLTRQIFSFRQQTCKDLHLFVAVKGISEYAFEREFKPLFHSLLEEDFLTLRHYPNKNQLSNLLDTIRGENIDDYDLFLKVDDDDSYELHYVEDIVRFHQQRPPTHSSRYQPGSLGKITVLQSYCPVRQQGHDWSGNSMALRKHVIEILFQIEADPTLDTLSRFMENPANRLNFGFHTNELIESILKEKKELDERFDYIFKQKRPFHLIVNKTNLSLTRDADYFLSREFRMANDNLSKGDHLWEHHLILNYKRWHEEVLLFHNKIINSHNGKKGDLLSFSDNHLQVKWEDEATETFVKTENKTWNLVRKKQYDMLVVSLPDNKKKRANIIERFAEQNLSFEFVDGVKIADIKDVRKEEQSDLEAYNLEHLKTSPQYILRAVGCKRAMIKAIRKAADHDSWVIIFQDDVHLTRDFSEKLNMVITQVESDIPDCGVILLHKRGPEYPIGKLYNYIGSDVRSMAGFAVHPEFAPKFAEIMDAWNGEDDRIWWELAKHDSYMLPCAQIQGRLIRNNQKGSDIISGIDDLQYYWK